MRLTSKLLIVAALVVGGYAVAEVVLKDEGTRVGPVNTINCSGAGVTCTRSGNTGTITVSASGTSDGGGAATPPTCASGEVLTSLDGGFQCVTDATGGGGGAGALVSMAADVTTGPWTLPDGGVGTVEFEPMTGLSWSASSGVATRFSCQVWFTTSATSQGIGFGVRGPAKTAVHFTATIQGGASNTTGVSATGLQYIFYDKYDNDATAPSATGSSVAGINTAHLGGFVAPSADGTVSLTFRTETSSGSATVLAGSYCVHY